MRAYACRLAPALFAIALGHAGVVHADPVPMKPVDPQRYAGRWYEVARLPNKIQADCAAATSDWSRQSDGEFDVVQTCHNGSEEKSWRGSGRITDASTNSKFRIGFFGGLIQKDYWIVDRADDYSWCMLTTPNSKFLWIMSRRPGMTEAQKAALVAHARSLGFDVSKLVYDAQPSA